MTHADQTDMPEVIYLIRNPEMEEDEDSHIIWSTAPDCYDAQCVVGKYRRIDPDTVAVKREGLYRAIGLLQSCSDWAENAASSEALKIIETALKGEK